MKKELLSHKKIMVNFITIIILIILNLENLSKAYSFEDTNLKKSIIFESINESSKCNNIIQNDTIKYPSTNNFSVEYFYLYIYPPFPQPARNMMRALIYWDINLKMDVSNITLYDINGVRVETGGNLTLDEINGYKGYITWYCSSYPVGVYICNVIYGNSNWIFKILLIK